MVRDYHDPRNKCNTYLCFNRVFGNELVDVNRLFLANPIGAAPLTFATA